MGERVISCPGGVVRYLPEQVSRLKVSILLTLSFYMSLYPTCPLRVVVSLFRKALSTHVPPLDITLLGKTLVILTYLLDMAGMLNIDKTNIKTNKEFQYVFCLSLCKLSAFTFR